MKAQDKQVARIIETTLALIAERGGAGVTMAAIAERAGISRQTVYNHFPDISSVAEAALELHSTAMADALRQQIADAGTPADQLAAIARFTIEASAGHAPLALETVLTAQARDRLARHAATPRAVMDEVIAAQHPGTAPDPALADLAWAIVEAGAATAGRHPEAVDRLVPATVAALDALGRSH
jgi:AcrR family transcriptional regulator